MPRSNRNPAFTPGGYDGRIPRRNRRTGDTERATERKANTMRNSVLALIALAAVTTAAPAQSWAEKMFKEGTSHDFGSVARGAQLFHRFPMTNIYAVRLDITNVQTSCGCATVTPSKQSLEPRETAYIDVLMDGRRFTGP